MNDINVRPNYHSDDIIKLLEVSMSLIKEQYPEEGTTAISYLTKSLMEIQDIRIKETKGE